MTDALHPTGRCECAGEGRCTWCLMDSWRARAEKAEAGVKALLASGVHDLREDAAAGLDAPSMATLRAHIDALEARHFGCDDLHEEHERQAAIHLARIDELRQCAADLFWLLEADGGVCTCEPGDVCPLCRAYSATGDDTLPAPSTQIQLRHALDKTKVEAIKLRAHINGLEEQLAAVCGGVDDELHEVVTREFVPILARVERLRAVARAVDRLRQFVLGAELDPPHHTRIWEALDALEPGDLPRE